MHHAQEFATLVKALGAAGLGLFVVPLDDGCLHRLYRARRRGYLGYLRKSDLIHNVGFMICVVLIELATNKPIALLCGPTAVMHVKSPTSRKCEAADLIVSDVSKFHGGLISFQLDGASLQEKCMHLPR